MKVKDIKKQLNQETGNITPDVLGRVKISPINRLRQNEKALRVFKTTIASLILLLMAAIVIILSVSIYAYMTQRPSLAEENYTFVSLWVYDGPSLAGTGGDIRPTQEDSHILNFVVDGDGKVIFAYDETSKAPLPANFYVGEVVDMIDPSGATAIYVMATSDRPAFQRQFSTAIRNQIEEDGLFEGIPVNYHVGDSLARFMMGASLNALDGFDNSRLEDAETVNDLCALYVEFAV